MYIKTENLEIEWFRENGEIKLDGNVDQDFMNYGIVYFHFKIEYDVEPGYEDYMGSGGEHFTRDSGLIVTIDKLSFDDSKYSEFELSVIEKWMLSEKFETFKEEISSKIEKEIQIEINDRD